MSTYDFDKVLSDYANGRITVEMAMGHSLQHIAKLYEALAANTNRAAEQTKVSTLEKRVNTHQAAIDRLTAFMEKVLSQQKKRTSPSQPKPD